MYLIELDETRLEIGEDSDDNDDDDDGLDDNNHKQREDKKKSKWESGFFQSGAG